MIVLLDTPQDYDQCEKELGIEVGQLLTPLTRRLLRRQKFGVDNGCFKTFNESSFRSLLERNSDHRGDCLFVTMPDIIGNARRTLELFDHFKYQFTGWPIALVMQNGQENFPIPWKQIQAVFIGGEDKNDGQGDWKLSRHAEDIIKSAKYMGKWVHVGRVNTHQRLDKFMDMEVDSVDGTGISRYSWMRDKIDHPKLELSM